VSSKTLNCNKLLTELFESFGEQYQTKLNKELK